MFNKQLSPNPEDPNNLIHRSSTTVLLSQAKANPGAGSYIPVYEHRRRGGDIPAVPNHHGSHQHTALTFPQDPPKKLQEGLWAKKNQKKSHFHYFFSQKMPFLKSCYICNALAAAEAKIPPGSKARASLCYFLSFCPFYQPSWNETLNLAQIPLAAIWVTLSPLSSRGSPRVRFNSKPPLRLTQGADS